MKKLLVFVISIAMLLAFSMPAGASLSTPWVITDNQATQYPLIQLAPGLDLDWPNLLEFGIYKLGDQNSRQALIDETHISATIRYDGNLDLEYVNFTRDISGNLVSGASGTFALDNTTGQFGFYFKDDTGLLEYDYYLTGENQYQIYNTDPASIDLLSRATTGIVVGSDIAPVPIPGAALLLGSGLIGLVGFRRRTNQS